MPLYRKSNSIIQFAKRVLPSKDMHLPIVRGPFRGGTFFASPRVSSRKIFGLYEAELNDWIERAFSFADLTVDVGSNDGYFALGAAAAMKRHGRAVRVIGFEPQKDHLDQLETARARKGLHQAEVRFVPTFVGDNDQQGMVTLDSFTEARAASKRPLIKIDVEGAEIEVLNGAQTWQTPESMFLIEVHKREFIEKIQTMLAGKASPLEMIEQKALPILGREMRDTENWWLVTKLA